MPLIPDLIPGDKLRIMAEDVRALTYCVISLFNVMHSSSVDYRFDRELPGETRNMDIDLSADWELIVKFSVRLSPPNTPMATFLSYREVYVMEERDNFISMLVISCSKLNSIIPDLNAWERDNPGEPFPKEAAQARMEKLVEEIFNFFDLICFPSDSAPN